MRSVSSQIRRVSARSALRRHFQQLRSASNTGERVLDLMSEHGGKAGDRARRASMGELPIHFVGDGPLLHHHENMPLHLIEW